MRDVRLVIEPFQLINLLECTIHKEVNQHFTAKITGHIAQTDNDELVQRCPKEQAVCIKIIDEFDEERVLFKGVVRRLSSKNTGGVRQLSIEAVSRSWLMDIEEHSRTFQHERQTYQEVAEFIKEKYQAAFIYTRGTDETSGELIVQYEETDWNFLKRIASQIHTVVVADDVNDNIALCFGIPAKPTTYEASSATYEIRELLDEYADKVKHQVEQYREQDALSYIFDERELWELCAPVKFLGNLLYIYQITSRYDGKELLHTYELRSRNGFKTRRKNNPAISGCSIAGTVIDVSNTFVKVHCDIDQSQSLPKAKWFDYSTVYSHPVGTGWYCMPEVGDAVRIYFPNEWERTGYAISAAHLNNKSQRRIDPNVKSLCTIFNKEIEFTPETIKITNNKGIRILLDDHLGISLFSDQDILLNSKRNIKINGEKNIEIHGKGGVDLKQRRNRINISDEIREWSEGIYHK